MSYIVIGLDPDLHNSGLGAVANGEVVIVEAVQVPKKLKDRDAAIAMANQVFRSLVRLGREIPKEVDRYLVVEGQKYYYGGAKGQKRAANPNDLLNLALVSGAAVAAGIVMGCKKVRCPVPNEWKGTVPKGIHQARVCGKLGFPFKAKSDPTKAVTITGVPKGLTAETSRKTFTQHQWKQVIDGCGLALWGYEELRRG